MIRAILACDDDGGIGLRGKIPWPHVARDVQWFLDQTEDSVMVMGRVTWEDSQLNHPIPNRRSYVVTRDANNCPDANGTIQGDITNGIVQLHEKYPNKTIWIIGGVQLVESNLPIIEEFYLSRIPGSYNCDRFLPINELESWSVIFEEVHSDVTFQILKNPLKV